MQMNRKLKLKTNKNKKVSYNNNLKNTSSNNEEKEKESVSGDPMIKTISGLNVIIKQVTRRTSTAIFQQNIKM